MSVTESQMIDGAIGGYITGLLWSTSCHGQSPKCNHLGLGYDCDRSLSDYYGPEHLTERARNSIRENVADFVSANLADLVGMEPEQIGHDFLLTRNREGVGFWDRGLGDRGDRLTESAHTFRESSAYVTDDDMIDVE